jgi:predicted transcriptional regulator
MGDRMAKKNLGVMLEIAIHEELRQAAEKENRSMSYIAARVIKEWLEKQRNGNGNGNGNGKKPLMPR